MHLLFCGSALAAAESKCNFVHNVGKINELFSYLKEGSLFFGALLSALAMSRLRWYGGYLVPMSYGLTPRGRMLRLL